MISFWNTGTCAQAWVNSYFAGFLFIFPSLLWACSSPNLFSRGVYVGKPTTRSTCPRLDRITRIRVIHLVCTLFTWFGDDFHPIGTVVMNLWRRIRFKIGSDSRAVTFSVPCEHVDSLCPLYRVSYIFVSSRNPVEQPKDVVHTNWLVDISGFWLWRIVCYANLTCIYYVIDSVVCGYRKVHIIMYNIWTCRMNWVAYAFTITPYVQNLNPRFGLLHAQMGFCCKSAWVFHIVVSMISFYTLN